MKNPINFEWNYSRSVLVQRKGFTKELNRDMAKICARHFDKYVPYKSGKLSNSVRIYSAKDHGTITYRTPYSQAQYYGVGFERTRTIHPLATSFWDKQCWINEKEIITKEVDDMRKRNSV